MKKIFSVFLSLFSLMAFAATETTVYYTASTETIGSYTVKLNVNFKGDGDDWHQYDMTKTELTYNGDPVYSCAYTDAYDGVGKMQFQLFEGETWKSQKEAINTWTAAETYNGKMFVHATDAWEAAPSAGGGGEEPTLPTVAVAGAFNNWSKTTNILTPAEDQKTASAKVTLAIQDYQFKMVIGNNWLCPQEGLYEMKRDNNSVSHIGFGGGEKDNFVLKCDAAGEYIFTWTYADSTLTITFPEEGGEVILPTVAVAGTFNNWSMTANTMTPAEDKLTASVKIALQAEDYQFKMVVGASWLCPQEGLYEMTRDNNSVSNINYGGGETDNFMLKCDAAGDYTFTWTFADNSLAITFPKKSEQGISNTAIEGKAVKTIMNGQLVIIKGGKVFNANGAQIQ